MPNVVTFALPHCIMNFNVSVVLLHVFILTVSVLANDIESTEFTETSNELDHLKSISILYGVANIASKHAQAANQCYRELKQIYDGIHRKEIWAIKALDSSAMPQPGFVLGHNFWMGSMQGCEAVQQPPPLTISNRFERFMHSDLLSATAPFDIGYRMVYAEHRSPFQIQVQYMIHDDSKILHVGLCLPRCCSNDEVANLTQKFFDSSTLTAQTIHDHRPNVLQVKDLKAKSNLMDKWSFRLIGFFVSFTLVMMLIAHLKERSENDEKVEIAHSHETRPETNGIVSSDLNDSTTNLADNCTKEDFASKKSILDEFIKCFSLRKNVQTLFSGKRAANAVPIVDGLKSIGCLVLVVYHVFMLNQFAVNNNAMVFSYGEQAAWLWISTAHVFVDLFFTISGLLISYNFLRNQSKLDEIKSNSFWQNVKLFFKQLLHRYVRLTPMYLVVIGCMECLSSRLSETSPFRINDHNDVNCSKYLWRNLLYIQNLFAFDELCMIWSWSLACEMQFTILSTAMLFVYAKHPRAAKIIFCSLVIVCIGLLFSIAILTKFNIVYEVFASLVNEMYSPTWTRILPHLVGVAAGYAMYKMKGGLPFSEKTVKMIWIVAVLTVICFHQPLIKSDISYITASTFLTIMRVLYPASISWMVLAGRGYFAKILNHPIFVHINKLSYGIYLLNPVVIYALYGWQDHSTHISPISMAPMTTGINVLVYLTAVVFSLMFEIPYTNISSKLLRQSSSLRPTGAASPSHSDASPMRAKKSQ